MITPPALVRRIGHVRAFSRFAALAVAAFLVRGMLMAALTCIGLRLVVDFCYAGLGMTIGGCPTAQGTRLTGGRILAAYLLESWTAVIIGKLIFA